MLDRVARLPVHLFDSAGVPPPMSIAVPLPALHSTLSTFRNASIPCIPLTFSVTVVCQVPQHTSHIYHLYELELYPFFQHQPAYFGVKYAPVPTVATRSLTKEVTATPPKSRLLPA